MSPAARYRWALAVTVLLVVVLGAVWVGNHFSTLDDLRRLLQRWQDYRINRPLLFAGAYFLLYVVVAAASLPGTALLTMAGGALFGLAGGTLLVSFASTAGATLACALARYLFRDTVLSLIGERGRNIIAGAEERCAQYLFSLRLVPIFPFFLVNLAMGLTNIRFRTFYWVSQVGMLPATIVYVNAGVHLSELRTLEGLMSLPLLASLVLVALLPWGTKSLQRWVGHHRTYRRWRKPPRWDFNLIVVGGGAAGLVTAYVGAAAGARVALIERHRMGGDCLNTGCVPSKALLHAAGIAQKLRGASQPGLPGNGAGDQFAAAMAKVARAIAAVAPHDSVERYTGLGVTVISGHATLVSPWQVQIDVSPGNRCAITAPRIVLATGATPTIPPLPGLDQVEFLTSDTIWGLEELPARLLVLGGGPIGCELAQAFARLGAQVTLVEAGGQLLGREDPDVAAVVERRFRAEGIDVRLSHVAVRVERRPDSGTTVSSLIVSHQGSEYGLPFDRILIALGRSARLEGFGLEALGIASDRTIVTDAYQRTTLPNIYAAGDCAGPYQFTHMAAHQAWYAAMNALLAPWFRFRVDYRTVPWATFVDPEVARVGLSEREARDRNIPHEVTRYELAELDRAIADGETDGFVKVLTPPGSDRILGAVVVAPRAAEMLSEFTLAMRHGLGLRDILSTIHVYPTWSEAARHVAGTWRRGHLPVRALRWARKWFSLELRART